MSRRVAPRCLECSEAVMRLHGRFAGPWPAPHGSYSLPTSDLHPFRRPVLRLRRQSARQPPCRLEACESSFGMPVLSRAADAWHSYPGQVHAECHEAFQRRFAKPMPYKAINAACGSISRPLSIARGLACSAASMHLSQKCQPSKYEMSQWCGRRPVMQLDKRFSGKHLNYKASGSERKWPQQACNLDICCSMLADDVISCQHTANECQDGHFGPHGSTLFQNSVHSKVDVGSPELR